MKTKKYKKLRNKLFECDIRIMEDLPNIIAKSKSYVRDRINGLRPWEVDEAYMILDAIEESEEKLHKYFPKGGEAS